MLRGHKRCRADGGGTSKGAGHRGRAHGACGEERAPLPPCGCKAQIQPQHQLRNLRRPALRCSRGGVRTGRGAQRPAEGAPGPFQTSPTILDLHSIEGQCVHGSRSSGSAGEAATITWILNPGRREPSVSQSRLPNRGFSGECSSLRVVAASQGCTAPFASAGEWCQTWVLSSPRARLHPHSMLSLISKGPRPGVRAGRRG